MTRMSILPRWMHRAYAGLLGYFWLPCVLCGEYSGGHEWRDIDGNCSSIPKREGSGGIGICPRCTRQGKGGKAGVFPRAPVVYHPSYRND